MKTSLVIMAAGIGSRFGAGIKQLAAVGPNGEMIMEYSIHDAIKAGFNKVVFIIRPELEADFKTLIGQRIEQICANHQVEVAYAYQTITQVPNGVKIPTERVKPWGTGQAVLACKEIVHEPFVVINADDYYGKTAFQKLHDFLVNIPTGTVNQYCMAGFKLENTLSNNGGVSRGLCQVSPSGELESIIETHQIRKTSSGAEAAGKALAGKEIVSMNMWGLTPSALEQLATGFREFFQQEKMDYQTAEYQLPTRIGELLMSNQVSVQVLPTDDQWFGMTYQADKSDVMAAFNQLTASCEYQKELFSDL